MARETDLSDIARTMQVMELSPTSHTQGRRIVFSGHLGLARDEYKRIVSEAGMVPEDRITWGVHFLCTNKDWTKGSTKGGKSSKVVKAERMNITIIDENELHEILSRTDDD